MDVCLLEVLYVIRYSSLRRVITRPEESHWVWCVCVWKWILDNEKALAPLGAVVPCLGPTGGLLCHGKINGLKSELTDLLTPCSTVLEKLTVPQPIKKFPTFYGTRRFITAFTGSRYLSLSWASSIQSTAHIPLCWTAVLITRVNSQRVSTRCGQAGRYILWSGVVHSTKRLAYGLDGPWFESRYGLDICSPSRRPDQSWFPTSLLFNGYPGSSPRINRPELEVNRSSASRAEVKSKWSSTSTYTAVPLCNECNCQYCPFLSLVATYCLAGTFVAALV
jgi:hypothetical protein